MFDRCFVKSAQRCIYCLTNGFLKSAQILFVWWFVEACTEMHILFDTWFLEDCIEMHILFVRWFVEQCKEVHLLFDIWFVDYAQRCIIFWQVVWWKCTDVYFLTDGLLKGAQRCAYRLTNGLLKGAQLCIFCLTDGLLTISAGKEDYGDIYFKVIWAPVLTQCKMCIRKCSEG